MEDSNYRHDAKVMPAQGGNFQTKNIENDSFLQTPIDVAEEVQIYDIEKKDFIQRNLQLIKAFQKLTPAVLGLLDLVSDILYYLSQPYAHQSVQDVFLAVLLFTPMAQSLIWNLYFSFRDYENRDQTRYNQRQSEYFEMQLQLRDMKGNGKLLFQLKVMFHLMVTYTIETFQFVLYILKNSAFSFAYAILQEIKLLPYLICFFDPTLKQVKYPITKPLIEEFRARKHLFQASEEIQQKNNQLEVDNKKAMAYNKQQEKFGTGKEMQIKQLYPKPQIYATHPLKTASIMNIEKSVINTLLFDPYVVNFLEITNLVKAVFESLPMLILQYINNSQLDLWDGALNKVSFILSVVMVLINSIQLMYTISQSETFPLIEFKTYVGADPQKRGKDILWLLQYYDDYLHIYDLNALQIAAQANSELFKTIKGLFIDFSSNRKAIVNCLQGRDYPFECISNIIQKMSPDNELFINISYNPAVTQDNIGMILKSIRGKQLRSVEFIAKNMGDFQETFWERELLKFYQKSKCPRIQFELDGNYLNITGPFDFNPNIEHLEMDFSKTKVRSLGFLSNIKRCTQLRDFDLDLTKKNGEDGIKEGEALNNFFLLSNLKKLNLQLQNNQFFFPEQIQISNDSSIEQLTINLYANQLKHIEFLSQFDRLSLLKRLNLNFMNNRIVQCDSLAVLSACKSLTHLTLNLAENGLESITPLRSLSSFPLLSTLEINLSRNCLNDISSLLFIGQFTTLKELVLDISTNQIASLKPEDFLKNLCGLKKLHLNFRYALNSINFDLLFLNRFSDIVDIAILIENNQISTLHLDFKGFHKKLVSFVLECNNNKITDISCLSNMASQQKLNKLRIDIMYNPIENFSPMLKFIQSLQQTETVDLRFAGKHFHDLNAAKKELQQDTEKLV